MASSLTNLEQFYVTGCPKVTERGVSAIISSSQPGLRALGLESVSPRFASSSPYTLRCLFILTFAYQNMSTFAHQWSTTEALNNLRSITLTISRSLADVEGWTKAVLNLLSSSPLERFQIYATSSSSVGAASDATVPHKSTGSLESTMATFWANFVTAHGHRLRRFSVHRMPIGLASIHEICSRCPNLEELFLVAEPRSLVRFLPAYHPMYRQLNEHDDPLLGSSSQFFLPRTKTEDNPYQLPFRNTIDDRLG
jgi:hypothetical protein